MSIKLIIITDLILKLYVFRHFYTSYFTYDGQNGI